MGSTKHSPLTFRICGEKRLTEYLRNRDRQLQSSVDEESDDYLVNADETSYVKRLFDEYSLQVPYLDYDHYAASTGKKLVPAERFPPSQFHVKKGRSYEKEIVVFHIPCKGDITLLAYYTDSFIPENGPMVFIADNHLCFEIINFYDDLERVKKGSQSVIHDIKTLSSKLVQEIESYNYHLELNIRHKLQQRKKKISNIAEVFGVPIRKSESTRTVASNPGLAKRRGEVMDTVNDETYDVFLSYASADTREALQIYETIIGAGGRVFLSEKSLKAGDDFAEAIRSALHGSTEVWLLLSPNSLRSEWVISEWGAAWVLRKKIIPILLRCAPKDAPDRIGRLHSIDFHRYAELVQNYFSQGSGNKRMPGSDLYSEKPHGPTSSLICPNCSHEGQSFLLSPVPSDFIEIENATHECSRCKFKTTV